MGKNSLIIKVFPLTRENQERDIQELKIKVISITIISENFIEIAFTVFPL